MITGLSRRERALMALALGIGVVLGGWELWLAPLFERQRLTAELIPVRQEILAQRLELVARRAEISGELDAARARIEALAARFLTAAPPAVAASELQKLAKDTAADARTDVRSERILTPVERGALLEIPIEIAVSGTIGELVDFLARLDAVPKLLTIRDLRIRVVSLNQPRDLLATLTLSGFILREQART